MAESMNINAQREPVRIWNRRASVRWLAATFTFCLVSALASPFQTARAAADTPLDSSTSSGAARIVDTLVANECLAAKHRDQYTYMSIERADRTGGHLWTEKVVETEAGKIRMLLAEDGKPLSPERIAQERGRLAAIVADPAAFIRKSQTVKEDEAHALQMLSLATRAFLFSEPRDENGYIHIDYRPNPAYQTQSMEERVLHGASGSMLIEPHMLRLHHLEGRLPADVSIGFGVLATVRAGSNFSTTRDHFDQPDWKTTQVDTDINGHIMFFKSIAKSQHSEHSNFVRVPNDLTVAQAVALAEQP
jgi:hypothetical protein